MSAGNVTERLAEWVAQAQFEDLPRRVMEEAKSQVLSVIASVHAGHFSDAGRAVSRTVKDWGGGKDATMMPSGERTSLYNAIFANTALSMALDYDDYLFAGHTGHSAVLVTLALAEKLGVSGKEFLLAQVLANEVEGRVGASALLGPLNGQLWSFIHLIGSAVIASKLLGLDKAQIQSAIGISLVQPAYPLQAGFFGSDAKTLLASMTAPLGVQAAQLAANGLRGAPDIIESPDGFTKVFARQPLMGAYQGLGKTWLTDTLSYKIYPGCAYIDTTIDCVLGLSRQHSIDGKKVKAVHIATGPLTLGMEALVAGYLKGPDSLPMTLNFTVGYNVAAALLDKELTARQFARDRIHDQATWNLAGRVHLTFDEAIAQRMRERALVKITNDEHGEQFQLDLGAVDLSTFRMSFGARVRIEMEDGRSFEAEQEVPIGGAGRPFDERRRCVEDKFRRETRYTLRKEKMEKAIDIVLHLEQANSAQLRDSSVSVAPNAVDSAPRVPILVVPGWEQVPGLVAGFCGRKGGVSQGPFAELNLSARAGDDATAVQQNWQRVGAAVGGAMRFVTMRQVHGADIVSVDDPACAVGVADAMVGGAPSVALCVLTADCVPLLLVALRYHLVAAVHAGWRGTLAGIAGRTLRHLHQVCGVEPDAIQVALGPAIGGCCYEVDIGVADALEQQWGTMGHAVRRGVAAGVPAGKATVDLRQVNRAQLLAAGMPADAIVDVGPCTRCAAAEYFSHRAATQAGTTTGRQVSFIGWSE